MNTPLQKAVQRYVHQGRARFHMPGHKGAPVFPVGGAARWDITEVQGADSLYEASGPIAETEARYAALYGAKATLLSAGGSTLCIQTMLALAAGPGARIVCARGCHTAAVNAMALLDIRPEWVYPEMDGETGLALAVTDAAVEQALQRCPDAAAVYLTSPNYFGVMSDIEAVAAVCRTKNIPLLVDNAHGAHLRFLRRDRHPIALGADLCCDSLHKTLPVLTGGALLHIGNGRFVAGARHRMSLFGSTSPSYLILLSIDSALPYLEGDAVKDLALCSARVGGLRALAAQRGLLLPRGELDPIRLAVGFAPTGMDAEAFRRHLAGCGVEPEYLSGGFCVLLAGGHNPPDDYERLEQALRECPAHSPARLSPPVEEAPPRPEKAMELRQALFGQSEQLPAAQAVDRVCAGLVAPCPPGVPVVMPGEILGKSLCDSLKKYGISSVNVLK